VLRLSYLVVSLPLGTFSEVPVGLRRCANVKYTKSTIASVRLSLGFEKLHTVEGRVRGLRLTGCKACILH
jgi:hypothetical protein